MDRKIQWYVALTGINTKDGTKVETNGYAGQSRDKPLNFPEGEYDVFLGFKWEEPPYKNSAWRLPAPTNFDPLGKQPYLVETEETEKGRCFMLKWFDADSHPEITDNYGQTMGFNIYKLKPISPEPNKLTFTPSLDRKTKLKLEYWITGEIEEHRDPTKPRIFILP
ncbi:hypothetical protein PISL3812_01798 [Talaromyces islandicus]|uniref:Uncharacterized protein n=1 Tax=Talaromyces islandicus TaxID=28573 RepID=A0A0U1LN42_TALIS|nr:hypothetical protein PISL3812_01798 [Talaromyces islandicus]